MILIRNARVVDPSQNMDSVQDILIENGKIKALQEPGTITAQSGTEIYDAKNLIVCPGFIDAHVHLREPGFEHKETVLTGTRAAVLGGFTSVGVMANTYPVNDNAVVTRYLLEKARDANQARVFPIGAVTKGQKGE